MIGAGRDAIRLSPPRENLAGGAGVRKARSWVIPRAVDHRLLAAHAREQRRLLGIRAGEAGQGRSERSWRARGQAAQEPALAKRGVAYYWKTRSQFEPRWPKFCVYRQVAMLRAR